MKVPTLTLIVVVLSYSQCTRQKHLFPTVPPLMGNVFERITNVSRDAMNVARNVVSNSIDSTIQARNIIVDRLRIFIEDFRNSMTQGIAKYRIPVLDPMTFNHSDFDVNHEMGTFKGSVDDVKVFNLSTFKLDNISSWLLQFVLNVTVPEINIVGKYDVKGKVGDMFNIFGNGPFDLKIFNVSLGIDTGLVFHGNKFSLSHLNLTMKITKMICNFKNLMGGGENEEVFNRVCGELAPEALDALWPEMEPAISAKVKQIFEIRIIPKGLTDYRDKLFGYMNRIQNSIIGK